MKKSALLIGLLYSSLLTIVHAQSWSLVWSDEFNGISINSNNWTYDTGAGGWGNSELEDYTARSQNATVSNGNLLIIGKKETYGSSSYTSARIKTQGLQSWTYGKIEARIKLPSGQGIWPAFWLLGDTIVQTSWPQCGEIDVMECINTTPKVYGTMHWYDAGNASYGGDTAAASVNTYHTYGIEWDSNAIRWTFDSAQYWIGNIAGSVNSTNAFHHPFFIILNLAIGGSWPGAPDGTTQFPDTMYVDWVRVYQKSVPTSVQENNTELKSQVSIYPQPTNGNTTLLISQAETGTYEITITNIIGTVCFQKNVSISNKQDIRMPLATDTLSAGVYTVSVKKDGMFYNTKLIKN